MSLLSTTRIALLSTPLLLSLGCGAAPPPSPDLRAFEVQRTAEGTDAVGGDEPALVAEADAAYARALEAHADGDVALRLHEVHLADIYWRTAVARHERLRLSNEQVIADQALRKARSELEAVRLDIARLEESEVREAARAAQGPAVSSSTGVISGQLGGTTAAAPEPPVAPTIDPAEAAGRQAELSGLLADLGPVAESADGVWVTLVGAVDAEGNASPQVEPVIADLLGLLADQYPEYDLSVEAYVTPGGDPSVVLMRSQAVALAMRNALVERGVARSKVRGVGRGAGERNGDLPADRLEIRFTRPAP